jgi:hypothetical protein
MSTTQQSRLARWVHRSTGTPDSRRDPAPASARRSRVGRRLGAATLVGAAAIGLVAACPAQALPVAGPNLYFTSPSATSLDVTDSVPSLSALNFNYAAQMVASNLSGVPIAVYDGINYTGTCTNILPSNNSYEAFLAGGPAAVFPRSVAINLTCGQDPSTLYGTPITIAGTQLGTLSKEAYPFTGPVYAPSSMVIDDPAGTRAWGTPTQTWTSNGGDNQRWYLKQVGTTTVTAPEEWQVGQTVSVKTYKLVSVIGNDYTDAVCLEAAGATPQVGATVDTYGCDPNAKNQPNQLWLTASVRRVPSGDSFPDNAGNRTDNTQVQAGMPVGVSVYSADQTGYSNVFFNAAMLTGDDPANYPVLTESSTLTPQNGSTLTMESQMSGDLGYREQSWWMTQPSTPSSQGATSTPCIGMYAALVGAC